MLRELSTMRVPSLAIAPEALVVGTLIRIGAEGKPIVDFPGNPGGPIEARTIVNAPQDSQLSSRAPLPLLLAFEHGDPGLPIIVGFVQDEFGDGEHPKTMPHGRSGDRDVRLDARTLVFDAEDEVVIRCGKSSITLRRDGKILVKGAEIVSRSSGPHKIKGAVVNIN